MCPAVGVSLQELAIGAASRSTVARFLIDARRRDGVMTQCVGRLGLKQLPMPVDVPTSRLLALSYRLVDGSQTIQACRSAAQGFDRLNPNGHFKFKEADSIKHRGSFGKKRGNAFAVLGAVGVGIWVVRSVHYHFNSCWRFPIKRWRRF